MNQHRLLLVELSMKWSPLPFRPSYLLAFLPGPQSGLQGAERARTPLGSHWGTEPLFLLHLYCLALGISVRIFFHSRAYCNPLPSSPPGSALQPENARLGRGQWHQYLSITDRETEAQRGQWPAATLALERRVPESSLNYRSEFFSLGFPGSEISAYRLFLGPEVRRSD